MEAIKNFISSLSKARENGFAEMEQLKKSGTKVVGTYCLFTPYEVIAASGALPVSLCGMSEEPIAHAEKHLPRNLCPLIKSSYGYAITGTCPYFFYSDLVVGETTCDGKKKMFEYMGKITPVHVMRLPTSNSREEDVASWRKEIVHLKDRIEQELGLEIKAEQLKAAIRERNEERRVFREFYAFSKLDPPPLSGIEVFRVLFSSGYAFDKRKQLETIRALTKSIRDAYAEGSLRTQPSRPRILITGCPLGGATEKVLRIVEESGGTIVCFENCGGTKDREELVDEHSDPYDALARKYLQVACSCMSPNDNRIKMLSRLIDEYKVSGVIDIVLQACHTYSVETYRIKEFVRQEKHIPYITLETDYSQSDEGQLRTRVRAFIEILETNCIRGVQHEKNKSRCAGISLPRAGGIDKKGAG
jgi:benzoyl-CoA reductase/2-hydroxyglutaryl-CoA dehydratase subunit BcrC/BadD/HgdB